jgi:hypothetical protein
VTPADWFEAFAAGMRFAFNTVEWVAVVATSCVLAWLATGAFFASIARQHGGSQREAVRAASQERLARRQPLPEVWDGLPDFDDWPVRPADTYERKDAA